MTATATIHIAHRQNVLLVPNGALRFTPDAGPAASGGFLGPQRDPNAKPKTAAIGRGSSQTIWVLGADGKPKPIQVTTGDSNGTSTEVSGPGLRPGMKVITGKLAAPTK
jgi:HlyD family secretion protein